jgi:hypothetical protein
MIAVPVHLEQQLISLAHKERATTDKIIEWALKSLEFDLVDVDDAEEAIADIKAGRDTVLTLDEFNKALANGVDGSKRNGQKT